MQVEDDISQLILENKKNTKGNRTGKLRRWSHCPNIIIFLYTGGDLSFFNKVCCKLTLNSQNALTKIVKNT